VRAKGQSLRDLIQLRPTSRLWLRYRPTDRLRGAGQPAWLGTARAPQLRGPNLIQGISFHDVKEGGPLAAACWTDGHGDVFIMTQEGKAIRFNEAQIPARAVWVCASM
jgi:hypothetical protein